MFQKQILSTKFEKFFRCGYQRKSVVQQPYFGEAFSSLNTRKICFHCSSEISGFRKACLLNGKQIELRNNKKYMSVISDTKCWKCNNLLDKKTFICSSCGTLQRPKSQLNYFELLGVSQMYDIDLDELTKNFRNLQMNFHPDKFANKSKEELEISETYSRLLNKAYTTLKDPVSRGFYILDFFKINNESTTLEQEFLIAIMEKNEELDNLDNLPSLMKFLDNNNESIVKQLSMIKDAFKNNKFNDAKANLQKLNYYLNLDNKIKEKQNSMTTPKDPGKVD